MYNALCLHLISGMYAYGTCMRVHMHGHMCPQADCAMLIDIDVYVCI